MQILRAIENEWATQVGLSVRTLVLTVGASDSTIHRIAGLGCRVECENEVFAALDKLMSDPSGYGLFIMDADSFGGLASGHRAFRLLGDVALRVPVILYSTECQEQVFPQSRDKPTVLRAPLSAISLRVGFEHALQARVSLYA